MPNDNLPAVRNAEMTVTSSTKPVLVTGAAMRKLSDPETGPSCERAVKRAMGLAAGHRYTEPLTVMIPGCPLTVHVDPARDAVILMCKFPGWPAVTDNLVEELLPFCSPAYLA